MKNLLTVYFIFFNFIIGFGQNLPDVNSLFSISPKWSYTVEDTNWYRIQDDNPHLDQFYGTFYYSSLIDDNYLYLLESGIGQTHSPPLSEGYFLHKINLNSGEADWIHFDNFYSGNTFVETVFGGNLKFDENRNIEVNGFKSLDSIKNISFDTFDDRVYVNVSKDVIDGDTGHLLEHTVELDTMRTPEKLHPGGFGLVKAASNQQLKYHFENIFEDGLVRNYLHFYDINESGNVSTNPVFSYKYTTTVDFDAPFLSYKNLYHQIDENTGVALFGSRDQAQGNIPVDLKLVFFDTSDSPTISVTEERAILEVMPENLHKSSGIVGLNGKDGMFLLSQIARIQIDSINFEKYIWIQWFDNKGTPIQKIDRLTINDEDIDFYSDFILHNNALYMIVRKIARGQLEEDKYYLIQSDQNQKVKVLSSFLKPNQNNDIDIVISGMKILDNNDLLLYLNINYPYNSSQTVKSNVSFLCRYNGEDLGLVTSTETPSKSYLQITPNPAINYLTLHIASNDIIENISIFDTIGNKYECPISGNLIIDISKLKSGYYYLRFSMESHTSTIPFIKI